MLSCFGESHKTAHAAGTLAHNHHCTDVVWCDRGGGTSWSHPKVRGWGSGCPFLSPSPDVGLGPPTPTWPWVSSLWPRPCGVQAWARSDSWAQRRGYWPPLSPAAKFKVGQHEPGQWALIGGEGLLPTSRRPQHRDPGHSPLDRTWHERVPQPPTSSTWAQFAFVCRFRCW